MAVRIRLMRMGSKRRPFYRFVVVDSRGKRDGGFLDRVGHYNPIAQPEEIKVDEEKIFDWLGKGAEISDGAHSLLKKAGILNRWDAKRRGIELPPAEVPAADAETPEAAAPAPAAEEPEEKVVEAAPEATAPEAVVPEPAAAAEPAKEEVPAPPKTVAEEPVKEEAAAPEPTVAKEEEKEVTEETEGKDTP